MQLPRVDSFSNGLGEWKQIAGTGSVNWESTYNGSAKLSTTGTQRIVLGRETGPLETGTNVSVSYTASGIESSDANVALVSIVDGDISILDRDNASAADGHLSARLPADLPRNGVVGIRLTATGTDVSTSLQQVQFTSPPGTSQVNEDFERTSLGALPNDWAEPTDPSYNAMRPEVVDQSATGDRALRLRGYYTPENEDSEQPYEFPDDDYSISVAQYPNLTLPTEGTTILRFRTQVTESSSTAIGSLGTPGVYFSRGETIDFDEQVVQMTTSGTDISRGAVGVTRGEWSTITVVHRRHDGRVRLTYYSDGKQLGSRLVTETISAQEVEYLAINSGSREILVDDVTVRTLNNSNPEAEFRVSPSQLVADPVANVSFNSTGSSDPDGEIDAYYWTFGDGSNETGRIVSHTYETPGQYRVNLIAVDDQGALDRTSQTLTVLYPGTNISVSGYEIAPTAPTVNENVTVSATLQNQGAENGTVTLPLKVDGSPIQSKEVSVSSAGTQTVQFTSTFATPGRRNVTVGSQPNTSLQVRKQSAQLSLVAATEMTEVNDVGSITATRPVTFTALRTDTDQPINGTLRIAGTTPRNSGWNVGPAPLYTNTGQNALAVDKDRAYLTDGDTIETINLSTGTTVNSFPTPEVALAGGTPFALAVGNGTLWFGHGVDNGGSAGEVIALDPTTGTVQSQFNLSYNPSGMAYGEGALWITGSASDSVIGYSEAGSQEFSFNVSVTQAQSLAYGNGSLWVSNRGTDNPTEEITERLYEYAPNGTLVQGFSDPRAGYAGLGVSGRTLYGLDEDGQNTAIRRKSPYLATLATQNGTAIWDNPASGYVTATINRSDTLTTNFQDETLSLTVLRESVDLRITPNRTTVPDEGSVRFRVRRSDTEEAVNASLTVANRRYVTGSDGFVDIRFPTPGSFEARTTKQQTDAARFTPASTAIQVKPTVEITDLNLSAIDNQTLEIGFTSNRSLNESRVLIRNQTDGLVADLTSFTTEPLPDGQRYTATTVVDPPGVYTATLITAETANDSSGALGQADSVVLRANGTTNLTAPATTVAPTIDGQLDELAWTSGREYTLTFDAGGQYHKANVSLLHDGSYLYLGLESSLPSGTWSRLNVSIDGNRDGRLAGSLSEPTTDIFVSYYGSNGLSRYRRYGRLGPRESLNTPLGLTRESSGDQSTYEYRIPLETLGTNAGDAIGVQFKLHPDQYGTEYDYYWPVSNASPFLSAEDWAGIQLEEPNVTAQFSPSPQTPVVGEPVTFDATQSIAAVGNITQYNWDFNGDGITDASGPTVRHRFTQPGSSQVSLRVTTNAGGTASVTQNIKVSEATPVAIPFNETFAQNATGWTIMSGNLNETDSQWTTANNGSIRLSSSGDSVQLSRPISSIDRGDRVQVAYSVETLPENGTLSVAVVTPDGDRVPVADVDVDSNTTTEPDRLSDVLTTSLPSDSRLVVAGVAETGQMTVSIRSASVAPGVVPPEPGITLNRTTPTPAAVVQLNASETTDIGSTAGELKYEWNITGEEASELTGEVVTTTFDTVGRKSVRLTVTDTDNLSTTTVQDLTVIPNGTESLVVGDDFEDDSVGTYPGGWRRNGNSDQGVSRKRVNIGERSLRIAGDPGGCWEGISNHPADIPDTGTVVLHAQVWVPGVEELDADAGCHANNVNAKLRTADSYASAGERVELISFENGGSVTVSGERTGAYLPGTWNSLRVQYERTGEFVRITHTLNGERLGSTIRKATEFENSVSYLSLSSGDTTVYYDDLVLATNQTSPAQSETPAPSPAISTDTATPVAGDSISFSAAETTGNVSLYLWDFDDDGVAEATGENATYTFTSSGIRNVTLTAVDERLQSKVATSTISVQLAESVAPFNGTTAIDVADLPSGALRGESEFASNLSVKRLSQTNTNTTLGIDAKNVTGNITVYIQRSELPTGDDTPALFVDGTLQTYYTTEVNDQRWVALTLQSPSNATVAFKTKTVPRVTARSLTTVNYPDIPVQLSLNITSPDDELTSISYELPNGRTASLVDLSRNSFVGQTNLTIGGNTWNSSLGRYEERNVTIRVTDAAEDNKTVQIGVTVYAIGDVTGDGVVDIFDAVAVAQSWHTTTENANFRRGADLNRDGEIDILDAIKIGRAWGSTAEQAG
jgi:PKD repeat protein